MGRERIIKKHVKRAGWYVVKDTSEPGVGHVLILRNRDTEKELKIRASSRPRAWRQVEVQLLRKSRAVA